MGINKTILHKVSEKTKDDPQLADFLGDLVVIESDRPGQFKKSYEIALKRNFDDGGETDENN